MEVRKTVIAKNIIALRGQFESLSDFARKAGIAPATLTTFLKNPEERNITLDNLFSISDICGVELWMLLIEEFPFEEIKKKKPLKRISADGYALLDLYERAPASARSEMLNYVAYQLRENPIAERKIRETQQRYTSAKISSTTPYPGCAEDFDP